MGRTFVREVMKIDLAAKKELISMMLLGVSAIVGILILVKILGLFTSSARAERVLSESVVLSRADANDTQKDFEKSKEVADELKTENLFTPRPKKSNPVSQVTGILGDEAMVNGKWCKVGDKVGDAEVTAIEPTCVKIEWNGREHVFAPLFAVGSSDSGGDRAKKRSKRSEQGSAEVRVSRERFGNRSNRARFRDMSPEEREARRAEFRQRRAERGRGEGGGGGRRRGNRRGRRNRNNSGRK